MKEDIHGSEILLEISAYLTGFEKADLLGTGMLEPYYEYTLQQYLNANDGNTLRSFLLASKKIMDEFAPDENAVIKAVKDRFLPYSKFNTLVTQIVTMWYMGEWNGNIISINGYTQGQAYVQGLVWDAAETHPPGAKQPGYGSWAIPPINAKGTIK
ncbi:hypothetical protein ACFO3O_11140 [Dokdonia ponticola]|uniref:Gluconate 2-dehydrogenase subunit 3 family protein n=1 Tax=Dokdonia ponticola TaxID=2041041 RepID=A0ABV9HYB0_9FLAO